MLPDLIPDDLPYFIGLIGVALYLGCYTLTQLNRINGHSYGFALCNLAAACCVLISLTDAFNLSSMLIQISYALFSLIGMVRLFRLNRQHGLSPREEAFIAQKLPNLPRPLAGQLLRLGEWVALDPGDRLLEQGQVADTLIYIYSGAVSVQNGEDPAYVQVAGTYIGTETLLNPGPAQITAVVTRPTLCLVFPLNRLHRLLQRAPEIRGALQTHVTCATPAPTRQRPEAPALIPGHAATG